MVGKFHPILQDSSPVHHSVQGRTCRWYFIRVLQPLPLEIFFIPALILHRARSQLSHMRYLVNLRNHFHVSIYKFKRHDHLHWYRSRQLVSDSALFPTKGQLIIVKGDAKRITTGLGDGWEAVVVPWTKANETFLGVSKTVKDW